MPSGPLHVDIEIDESQITITDRAAGIAWHDFPRAFSPSQPPPNDSGLSEFGLGMKAAACWFADKWEVETTAINDPVVRTVRFDIGRITGSNLEHLPITTRVIAPETHYAGQTQKP